MQDVRDTVVDLETQSFFWDRYMALGKTAFQGGRLTEANRMFTMSLKAGMSINDTSRRAYSLAWIAHVHYELGNLDDSDRLLRQVFQGNLDLDRDQEECEHLYELLGLVQERQGRLNEAHETYGLLVDKASARGMVEGKAKMAQYQSKQKELARLLFPDQFVEPAPGAPTPVKEAAPDLFDSIESLSKPAVSRITKDKPAAVPPPAKEEEREEKASFEVLAGPGVAVKETKSEQAEPVQEMQSDPPGVEDDLEEDESEEEEEPAAFEEEPAETLEEDWEDEESPLSDGDESGHEENDDQVFAGDDDTDADYGADYEEENQDDYLEEEDQSIVADDDYADDEEDVAEMEAEFVPSKFVLASRPKPAHIERRKIPVSKQGVTLVTTAWDFSGIN